MLYQNVFRRESNAKTSLKFTYTAMHGVGCKFVEEAFKAFNLPGMCLVKDQVHASRCVGRPIPFFVYVSFRLGRSWSRVSDCKVSKSWRRQKCIGKRPVHTSMYHSLCGPCRCLAILVGFVDEDCGCAGKQHYSCKRSRRRSTCCCWKTRGVSAQFL